MSCSFIHSFIHSFWRLVGSLYWRRVPLSNVTLLKLFFSAHKTTSGKSAYPSSRSTSLDTCFLSLGREDLGCDSLEEYNSRIKSDIIIIGVNLRATKGGGTHPLRFFDITLFASGIQC